MSLPVLDLNDTEGRLAAALDDACRYVGFFAIVGHGVPQRVVDDAWEVTSAFFELPFEEKMQARDADENHPYGYFPQGQEALAASLGFVTPPDLKESFNLAPPAHHADPTGRFGGVPRIWPRRPRGFEQAWTSYYDELVGLSERLLRLFALALGVDPGYFAPAVDQHLSALRGLNYPPLPHPPAPGQLRAGVHSDYGTLTVLLPGPGTGGLEVQRADGTWSAVAAVDGGFIVNIGDMMARWTNDRWRSTRHRVVVPHSEVAATERRQAIAFFHQPNWDAEVKVVPTCVSAEDPARYEPVLAGPWLMHKFDAASTGS